MSEIHVVVGADALPTVPRPRRLARQLGAGVFVLLAVGQLVGYLVLTTEPNPGIAATAVLPLGAAAAVALLPGRWVALAGLAGLLVSGTIVGTRSLELSFDLARPDVVGPFVFSVVQLAACGVAAAVSVSLLLPPSRPTPWPVSGLVAAGLGAAVAVGAALLVVLPQGDDTGGLSESELAALPTISMVDYRFEPAQVRVPAGRPLAVRLTNDGSRPHSMAIEALGIDVEVPSGRTRTVVVQVSPGTHELVCSVGDHEQQGMTGRVVVMGPDGAEPEAGSAQARGDDGPGADPVDVFEHARHTGHTHASAGSGSGRG